MITDSNSAKFSRRNFLKGVAVVGGAAALSGCGSSSDDPVYITDDSGSIVTEPELEVTRVYGSTGHNCGGRCVSVAEVSNGRVVRILTDESKYGYDGTLLDENSRNFPQTRSCARCRSYKYRIYHPGRLLYPLKQTKKRGDLDGFIRITWEQAYKEIITKHQNVLDKYGIDGIYQIYACGSVSSQLNGSQSGPIGKTNGYAMRVMGGVHTPMFGSYSTHQYTYFGMNYTGCDANMNSNALANYTKTLMLWGDNSLSTANNATYSTIKGVEDMKHRDGTKVIYLGPECVDTAVTIADEWIVSKPFTDPAIIAGMVYHMLDNTFDLATGALKANPWLDIDYLDTMVYGFFDSPAYNLNETNGIMAAAVMPAPANTRNIDAVPAGRSYCSWVLGNNTMAPTYATLGASRNYTSAQYAALDASAKRWSPCSYDKPATSKYYMKEDFTKPKTPAWASAISGVPEESIKELARMFVQDGPVASRWSGGLQKHYDGIQNLYAHQMVQIITKNVGVLGAGYYWIPFTSGVTDTGTSIPGLNTYSATSASYPIPSNTLDGKPQASCTAWHTALKMCYGSELKNNGYTAQYIPNWPKANKGQLSTGDVYWDDGGTRAFIKWKRNPSTGAILTYTDDTGASYYDWEGRTGTNGTANAHDGTPVFSGIRLLYNAGGGLVINQHENSNDSADMMSKLPACDYNDADSFCLVSIDNFLSPTPRYSDYVLPGSTFWEQQDIVSPYGAQPFYTPAVSTPPGESKPVWDIGADMVKTYANMTSNPTLITEYFASAGGAQTVEGFVKYKFKQMKADSATTSVFKDKTWEEYKQNPYVPAKQDDFTLPVPARKAVMDAYKSFVTAGNLHTAPFIVPNTASKSVPTNEYNQGGYGNQFATTTGAPKSPKRFQLYSPVLIWQYKNKFSMWHGYLKSNTQYLDNGTTTAAPGQSHLDYEGHDIVLPIPLFYDYRDYFKEAYGGFTQSAYSAPNEAISKLQFLLTTTHNRYRSHSSMAENPILRELSHRVPGQKNGKFIPANDFNYYAMGPAKAFSVNNGGEYPELSDKMAADGTVAAENKDIVSYTEIWMNQTDGEELIGIKDGDLILVENQIGAVYCVARLTRRCARGFVGLHQGCWYDPRKIPQSASGTAFGHDIIDVGGCANTLMASQPSRIDHGNGQQSAMVRIVKVNY